MILLAAVFAVPTHDAFEPEHVVEEKATLTKDQQIQQLRSSNTALRSSNEAQRSRIAELESQLGSATLLQTSKGHTDSQEIMLGTNSDCWKVKTAAFKRYLASCRL